MRCARRESVSESPTRVQGTRISSCASVRHRVGLCISWELRFLAHPFPSQSPLYPHPTPASSLLFLPLREPGGVKRPTFLLCGLKRKEAEFLSSNHHVVGSFPTPSCKRRTASILSGGQKGSGHPSSNGQCWFPKVSACFSD